MSLWGSDASSESQPVPLSRTFQYPGRDRRKGDIARHRRSRGGLRPPMARGALPTLGSMRHTMAALTAILLCHAPTALAKCAPVQCSAVQVRVAACAPAKLNPAGALVLTTGEEVSSRLGEVGGLVLSGVELHQHPTPCYEGCPRTLVRPTQRKLAFSSPRLRRRVPSSSGSSSWARPSIRAAIWSHCQARCISVFARRKSASFS